MNFKWTVSIFLGFLVLFVVAQNARTMEFRFLFWQFSASRVIFLMLAFALGLILGFIWGRCPRRCS
ncbi:MAG: LapA family protein [Candidatus Omnitrophica bacterium]|nr:LapA family protein [Candidatus Omnitrophota bacterium]MBI5023638.1 LapA family protein [Candidatus Omnitrophota bacterium]